MRPLEQGAKAAARDVSTLTHVLKRVTEDVNHDPEERQEIASLLRNAITALMKWTEPADKTEKKDNGKPRPEQPRSRAER